MRSGGMRPGAGAGAGAVGTLNWRADREVRCRNFYAMAGRLAGENAGPRKPWLSLAEFMTELFQTNTLEQWEWASAMRCVRLAILPHRLTQPPNSWSHSRRNHSTNAIIGRGFRPPTRGCSPSRSSKATSRHGAQDLDVPAQLHLQ